MKRQKLFFIFCTIVFHFLIASIFTSCGSNAVAGTYTREGNTAIFYIDGYDDDDNDNFIVTVSGNKLSVNLDGEQFTMTRINTSSNPFAGTWKGTDEDGDSVEIIFGDTFLMAYYTKDIDDIDEGNVGDYEYDGNEAEWEIDGCCDEAVISDNRLRGTFYEIPFTAAKINTSSNPFAGAWRGHVEGTRFEVVIGEITWAIRIF